MNYQAIRQKLTRRILDVAYSSKEGHIPSSLSILDIIYFLYKNKKQEDVVVLSKGHSALGLYVVLEHFGLLHDSLDNFCKFDSKLGGHPYCYTDSNITCATGSLGHGLPFSAGIALAKKIKKESGTVYVIIGDGEANEGTIWETALLASEHKLDNLYCILDHNESTNRALNIDNIRRKFDSFNWFSLFSYGHSLEDLEWALTISDIHKPIFLECETIKGYGIETMENNPEWHHKIPNEQQYKQMIKEIK